MTNLIAKVAELRELEARAEGIEYFSIGECELNYDTVEFLENMRIAAPKLLAALGKVQAGDVEILEEWLYQIEEEYGEDGVDPKDQPITKLLRRYRDMARIMEDSP